MITLNNHNLYEIPSSCGTCPFLMTGSTNVPGIHSSYQRGVCFQWNETHHTWANIPRRCLKLFKTAFKNYDDSGENLVVVSKK